MLPPCTTLLILILLIQPLLAVQWQLLPVTARFHACQETDGHCLDIQLQYHHGVGHDLATSVSSTSQTSAASLPSVTTSSKWRSHVSFSTMPSRRQQVSSQKDACFMTGRMTRQWCAAASSSAASTTPPSIRSGVLIMSYSEGV